MCVRVCGQASSRPRAVMILSEIEGFKNRDIADILQISLDNVKIRLHRARASLKSSSVKGVTSTTTTRHIWPVTENLQPLN